MKNKAWTPEENRAVVALYFAMLDHAVSGEPYNKAAMIRAVQGTDVPGEAGPLIWRSRGSIEAKLMNCSAAHAACDPQAVTMDGFG